MVCYYLLAVFLSLDTIIFRFPVILKVILYVAKVTQSLVIELL